MVYERASAPFGRNICRSLFPPPVSQFYYYNHNSLSLYLMGLPSLTLKTIDLVNCPVIAERAWWFPANAGWPRAKMYKSLGSRREFVSHSIG